MLHGFVYNYYYYYADKHGTAKQTVRKRMQRLQTKNGEKRIRVHRKANACNVRAIMYAAQASFYNLLRE